MSALALAGLAAAGAAAGVAASGMFRPRSSLLGPVHWRGTNAAGAEISLTFDDGPWPGSTELILETLASHSIRAAFFVIGRHAAAHPALIRRIHEQGHVIANHSFDHHRLGTFCWSSYWRRQIDDTADAVERAAGVRPALFRPPMGFKTPSIFRAAHQCGCRVVNWSRRTYDGVDTNPDAIVRRAAKARPRDILLLHDGRDPASSRQVAATAQVLPDLIRTLRDSGLAFARLDDLIGMPAYQAAATKPPAALE